MRVDRLRLLASAFAGRTLEVASATAGEPAWTDGSTIYVDPGAEPVDQVRALAVQASLLASGSLEPHLLRRLARRPAVARRYLAVEGHRVLAANEEVLPPVVLRVLDREIATMTHSPETSLELARGRHGPGDAPLSFGALHPRRLLTAIARTEVVRAAAAPPQAPRESAGATDLVELDEEDDGGEDLGHLLSSPVGGGGAVGRLFRRLLLPARDRSGGGPPGADAPTHSSSARPGSGHGAAMSMAAPGSFEGSDDARGSGAIYPEWDVHRGRYRPDWCSVQEAEPTMKEVRRVTPVTDHLGLRRPLARLGIGLDRCRRQRQGDDIDIDAAVEARVDALAGAAHGDEDFYIESLRRRRDLAVLLLLDVSGSSGEPGTAGKTVHEHQRAATAAFTAALHGLGDRVAVYAFNSRGRQAVQLVRVKSFDDHLDGAVAKRLASLTPGAYTRLGAAIRHGTSILEERAGTPRRLLVVLSDGFAYDHGYEGRYGEADARRALLEARRRGVGCVCLSVGTGAEPAALRRVFGTAAHATVPRTEQLPRVVGPLFRSALRTAEAQRRAFQRTERTKERLELERRTDVRNGPTVLRAGR